MDHQLCSFSAREVQALGDLAAIVEGEFKALDAATSDGPTGLFNRRGLLTLAEYALLMAQRRHEPVGLALADLDRFKHINDTWGHEESSHALIAIVDLMKAAFHGSDILARQGGDEFIILFANTSRHDAAIAMEMLSHNVTRSNQQAVHFWQLALS